MSATHPENARADAGCVPIDVPGIFTTEDLNLVMDKMINLDAPDDDEILRVARLWLKEYAKAQVDYDAITKDGWHRDESEVFDAANGLHRAVLHMKASTKAGLAAQLKLLRWEMATMFAKRRDDGWEWEGGMYEDWDWSLRQMIASVRVVEGAS